MSASEPNSPDEHYVECCNCGAMRSLSVFPPLAGPAMEEFDAAADGAASTAAAERAAVPAVSGAPAGSAASSTSAALADAVRVVAAGAADHGTFDVLLSAVSRIRDLPGEALADLMLGLEKHSSAVLALQMQVLADLARPGRAGDPQELAGRFAVGKKYRKKLSVVTDGVVDELADAAQRLAVAEVAAVLNISSVSVRKRLGFAVSFTGGSRRGFWDLLRDGVIDRGRMYTIDEELAGLSDVQQAHIDEALTGKVAGTSNAQLRALIRREVLLMDPGAAEAKAEVAVKGRRVRVYPEKDNMASFNVFLPADAALTAFTVLDRCSPRFGDADDRCVDQRRADTFGAVFQSLLTDGVVTVDQLLGNIPTGSVPAAGNGAGAAGTGGVVDIAGAADVPDTLDASGVVDGACAVGTFGVAGTAGTGVPGGPVPGSGPQLPDHPSPHRGGGASPTAGAPGGGSVGVVDRRRTMRKQGRDVTVHVHLSLATLLGLDSNPGTLDGYGTITAGYARALAESAGTVRVVLTDPGSGYSVLTGSAVRITNRAAGSSTTRAAGSPGAGRGRSPGFLAAVQEPAGGIGDPLPGTRSGAAAAPRPGSVVGYRPSQRIRDDVTAIWTHCTFPACRQPSWRADLDHRQEYNHGRPEGGGDTSVENLQPLCRGHHLLKTFTDWDCAVTADGTIRWTSPTGHVYPVRAEPYFAPDEWLSTVYSPPPAPIRPTPWQPASEADSAVPGSVAELMADLDTPTQDTVDGADQPAGADQWPDEPPF